MKKRILSILIIIVLLIPIIHYIFKNEHIVSYQVKDYTIEEYYYQDIYNYYDLVFKNNDNSFIISYKTAKGKHKKIIKDIKTIKQNNLECIIPTIKKEEYAIACTLDKEQVSIDYLIKTSNKDFKTIQKKIKKFNLSFPSSEDNKTTYKSLNVYNSNIDNNTVYYIWNYKGIFVLNKGKNEYQKILEYDLYDNIEACTVKDYFVLLENSSVGGIEQVYYYKNNKLNTYKLPKKISKNSYINGVINNTIYITDRDNKKEYTLDIKRKRWEEIDQEETTYVLYQDKQKKEVSKSDFFMEDKYFSITKMNHFQYYQEENKIYKQFNNNKVLLLELDQIKEWYIKANEIILLKEDTIYAYNEEYGLRKILENSELKYNYHNIVQVGGKY